ncbi:hypothetical protein [Asticcacaulis solisilvae]|uniref:hypothetical protein n=1 Tax=Asticcacaulis solisilvae TaxID=1217274 RepID=UPI003FD7E1C1
MALPKGLRNTLISLGLCAGLIGAYYVTVSSSPVPSDTEIVFAKSGCGGACAIERVVIAADGRTEITEAGHKTQRTVSAYALRNILITFRSVHFLDQDVAKWRTNGAADVCLLGLTQDHRKVSIRYACGDRSPVVTRPLGVIRQALK